MDFLLLTLKDLLLLGSSHAGSCWTPITWASRHITKYSNLPRFVSRRLNARALQFVSKTAAVPQHNMPDPTRCVTQWEQMALSHLRYPAKKLTTSSSDACGKKCKPHRTNERLASQLASLICSSCKSCQWIRMISLQQILNQLSAQVPVLNPQSIVSSDSLGCQLFCGPRLQRCGCGASAGKVDRFARWLQRPLFPAASFTVCRGPNQRCCPHLSNCGIIGMGDRWETNSIQPEAGCYRKPFSWTMFFHVLSKRLLASHQRPCYYIIYTQKVGFLWQGVSISPPISLL